MRFCVLGELNMGPQGVGLKITTRLPEARKSNRIPGVPNCYPEKAHFSQSLLGPMFLLLLILL